MKTGSAAGNARTSLEARPGRPEDTALAQRTNRFAGVRVSPARTAMSRSVIIPAKRSSSPQTGSGPRRVAHFPRGLLECGVGSDAFGVRRHDAFELRGSSPRVGAFLRSRWGPDCGKSTFRSESPVRGFPSGERAMLPKRAWTTAAMAAFGPCADPDAHRPFRPTCGESTGNSRRPLCTFPQIPRPYTSPSKPALSEPRRLVFEDQRALWMTATVPTSSTS